ncbi:hypothetical protein BDV98DRAFT_307824 [Pterulicium gracile]|uniref:Transmembrane protein n=1 Tax=Pterulicium gracile TaxID=1884261 RepID=A0A5C3QDA0_9AGAR|nr:hypothetical protein BDV98DRAFT_307824 [Pterula gracilis]
MRLVLLGKSPFRFSFSLFSLFLSEVDPLAPSFLFLHFVLLFALRRIAFFTSRPLNHSILFSRHGFLRQSNPPCSGIRRFFASPPLAACGRRQSSHQKRWGLCSSFTYRSQHPAWGELHNRRRR